MRRQLIAGMILFLVAAGALPAAAQEDGAQVFQETCSTCHQADAMGIPGTFPPLRGNPNATDASHVEEVVRNGLSGQIEVNGQTFDGRMPAQSALSDSQVEAVVAYVVSIAAQEPSTPSTTPSGPVEGDAARGEALFRGSSGLSEGGPACAACHTAGSVGRLGGVGLGPDLTEVFSRFGGATGLTGALHNPPSPTMQPIFTERPLDDQEVADLVAFFSDPGTRSGGIDLFGIYGLAGLALLLLITRLWFSRPRQSYADQLRSSR